MNYTRMSNMILFDIGFRHVCSTSIDRTKEINAYPEKHYNHLKNVLIDFCKKCDKKRYDYVDFTFIKDLFDIKKELEQLKEQYFKDYPFATNKDFENNVISATLTFLEKIRDSNFIYSGLTIENWHFYRTTKSNISQFYLAVDNKDIDFIKQYAKKVLELVYNTIEPKENIKEKLPPSLNNKATQSNKKLLKNKYPHIFKNDKAYTIFEEYIKTSSKKMDFSFIYREMLKDKLILETVKPSNFRDFINEHYNINGGIDKIYTMHRIGKITQRRTIYNQIKEKYKHN